MRPDRPTRVAGLVTLVVRGAKLLMKTYRVILFILISIFLSNRAISSKADTLETYSASEILKFIKNDPEKITDKQVILSSCGVDVLECCNCDNDAYVIHVDHNENLSSTDEFRKMRLAVYGTKRQRSACKRIGYQKCGLYQGSIQIFPSGKNIIEVRHAFVVSNIIEEQKKDLRRIINEKEQIP